MTDPDCSCVRVTDDGITDMAGCPVHGGREAKQPPRDREKTAPGHDRQIKSPRRDR